MTYLGKRNLERLYETIHAAKTGDILTIWCPKGGHHGVWRRTHDLYWVEYGGRIKGEIASWEIELLLSDCDTACLS